MSQPLYVVTRPLENRRFVEQGVLPAPLRIYTSAEIARWYEPIGQDAFFRVIHPDTLTAFSLSPAEPRPLMGGALKDELRKNVEDLVQRNWFASSKTAKDSLDIMCTAIVCEDIPIEKTGVAGKTMQDTFPFFDSSLGLSRDEQAAQFYFSLTAEKMLPEDFDQWSITLHGKTLAHELLDRGRLPERFDQWSIRDADRRTVAHHAAAKRMLPPDFDQWDLREKGGWSVAHESAHAGWLPADFSQWDISDASGVTILDVIRSRLDMNHLLAQHQAWIESNHLKETIGTPSDDHRSPSFIRRGF